MLKDASLLACTVATLRQLSRGSLQKPGAGPFLLPKTAFPAGVLHGKVG